MLPPDYAMGDVFSACELDGAFLASQAFSRLFLNPLSPIITTLRLSSDYILMALMSRLSTPLPQAWWKDCSVNTPALFL